jgi:hypothetical protein
MVKMRSLGYVLAVSRRENAYPHKRTLPRLNSLLRLSEGRGGTILHGLELMELLELVF